VAIGTQPNAQYRMVTAGAGSNVSADESGVSVSRQSNPMTYSTAGSYTFTVPEGITSLQVVATGAGGGAAVSGQAVPNTRRAGYGGLSGAAGSDGSILISTH